MQGKEGELHQMSKTENSPVYIILLNAAGSIIQDTYNTF